jgi:hypothetical protein
MELSYRWSLCPHVAGRPKGLYCFYVSTEAPWRRILQKAHSFGWFDPDRQFNEYGSVIQKRGYVSVLGQDHLSGESDPAKCMHELIAGWSKRLQDQFPSIHNPDVLIIDSLNLIYGPGQREEAFIDLFAKCTTGPLISVFVVESTTGFESHRV